MNQNTHIKNIEVKNKRNSSGFSLVELLVVIAILAVLAAIAIPLFLNQREKAARASVVSDAKNVATSLNSLLNTFPPNSTPTVSYAGGGVFAFTLGGVVENVNVPLSPNTTATVRTDVDVPPAVLITSPNVPSFNCSITLPPANLTNFGVNPEPVCGTIVSDVGNLLPYMRAYAQSGVWSVTGAFSLSQNSANSTLVSTVVTTTSASACTTYNNPEVEATYTFEAFMSVDPSSVRSSRVLTQTYNASNVITGTYWGNTIPPGGSGLSKVSHEIVAGSTRILVCPAYTSSPVVGDKVTFSKVALWKGDSAGVWAPPGQPIVKP